MLDELEQRMLNDGDTTVKFIRVGEGGGRSRFYGNVMISIKHYRDSAREMFSVRIFPLVSSGKILSTDNLDKFSINKFEAVINHNDKNIRLGPNNGVQLEDSIRNKGVGCYAFNELVKSLKDTAPDYAILSYEVSFPDEQDNEKKDSLGYFLNKFNITFTFSDIEKTVGVVKAPMPAQLFEYYNSSKIMELGTEEFIFKLINDKDSADTEISHLKEELARVGDESFGGIPKKEIVRYTLICCGISIIVVFLLLL